MVKKKPAKKNLSLSEYSAESLSINLLILSCFLLSGLAGLVYQVLWIRMIDKVIGSAPFAVATVLTVFMGGLALGSYFAGKYIDQIDSQKNLLSLYGKIEVAIGIYGLLLPFLAYVAKPLYAIAYNHLLDHFSAYQIFAFSGCSVLLIIPTGLMGATLPILCRFYIANLDHLGTRTGRLYGINTIGAAAGALLCGFLFINAFGVWGSLLVAAGINFFVGFLCITYGRFWSALGSQVRPGNQITKKVKGKTHYRSPRVLDPGDNVVFLALLIFAVSGFCGMAYEVIWTRLLGLIMGPTTYSFTIVVATFIVGLATGSFLFGWLGDKTENVFGMLVGTQIGAASFSLIISQFLGNSQLFFAKLIYTFQDYFEEMILAQSFVLFFLLLAPTLLLGASFPLVSRIYARSLPSLGRSIGTAYAINTVGAILGSFLAGFVFIPFLGKENGLRLTVALQFIVAFITFIVWGARLKKTKRMVPLWSCIALIGALLLFSFPSWNRQLLSRGHYRKVEESHAGYLAETSWLDALWRGPELLSDKIQKSELLFYGDGIGGFTTVEKMVNSLGSTELTMLNSGKPDASTHGDRFTQTLLAHIPMLFHPNPKKVMVLGLASGMTAGEVLHYPIDRVDVLEISDQVIEASKFFNSWNNGVLTDSKARIIVQDGRNHLALIQEKYDVIISEPSNPWMAGLANLFTRDFFELVRERLSSDGIFVQWIHGYEMNWNTFAMVGRTFSEVFPNGILMNTLPTDYLLLGFTGVNRLDIETARENLQYINRSSNIELGDPRLLFHLILTEDSRRYFGSGPLHTDNRPRLEYLAPRQLYIKEPIERLQKRWISKPTEVIIASSRDADALLEMVAFSASAHYPRFKYLSHEGLTTTQRERYSDSIRKYCKEALVSDYGIFADDISKIECARIQSIKIGKYLELNPGDTNTLGDLAAVQNNLGIAMASNGQLEEALSCFLEASRIRPNFANSYNNMGLTLAKQGKFNEAIEKYAEALRINPNFAEAHGNMGNSLMGLWKFEEAVTHFKKALLIKPGYKSAKESLKRALDAQAIIKKNTGPMPSENSSRS